MVEMLLELKRQIPTLMPGQIRAIREILRMREEL
jgi:hypothetical protein